MRNYRKLIAAAVGFTALIAVDVFGVDSALAAEGAKYISTVVEAVIAIIGLWGVWGLRNDGERLFGARGG